MLSPSILNAFIKQNKNIWVAYSGGVDSHVLLQLAKQVFPNVQALHVNHNWCPDDEKWQQHCEKICAHLQVPLTVVKATRFSTHRQGFEAAARQARIQAWRDTLTVNDMLLLAHHADDQAETILYRLMRGAGPKGLTGMRNRSAINNVSGKIMLARPLLDVSKQEILAYARQANLHWVEDRTNANQIISRNYIRHKILPNLIERWPVAVRNINRAGKLCAQLIDSLDPLVAQKLQTMLENDHELNLRALLKESLVWQKAILRAWLARLQIIPSVKQLAVIVQEIIHARKDAMPEMRLRNLVLRRSKDKLYLRPFKRTSYFCEGYYAFPWNLQEQLLLPNGKHLTAEMISADQNFMQRLAQFPVTVRIGSHGHKAKKIFQQYAIPPWERVDYPVIFVAGRLVAIAGLWQSPRF